MEKDTRISKLFRESGIVHAPEGFTRSVMERIEAEPVRKTYKPIIGKTGRILLILFVAGVVAFSLIYSFSGEAKMDPAGGILNLGWQLPSVKFSLDFLKDLRLQPWVLSTIVALFLLVLSDAGLRRRKIF
jgi:hypothetical protein